MNFKNIKENLTTIFRVAAIRVCDPEVKRSPADDAESRALYAHMVGQVSKGVAPENATPPAGMTAERSRSLLKGTGIHHELEYRQTEYQKNNPGMSQVKYAGEQNQSLPKRVLKFH